MSFHVYQTFMFLKIPNLQWLKDKQFVKSLIFCRLTTSVIYTHTLLSHSSYTYDKRDNWKWKKKVITTAVKCCKLTALSLRNLIFTRPFRRIKKAKNPTDYKVWGQSDTLTFYQDFPQKSSSSQIFSLSKLPDNFPALLLLPLMSCSDSAPCSVSLWMLWVCDTEAHTSHSE